MVWCHEFCIDFVFKGLSYILFSVYFYFNAVEHLRNVLFALQSLGAEALGNPGALGILVFLVIVHLQFDLWGGETKLPVVQMTLPTDISFLWTPII